MANYQLGKICKIIDLDSNQCYIGSTCEPTLAKRLAKHVSDKIISQRQLIIAHFNLCVFLCIGNAGAAQRVHKEEATGVWAHHC